MGQTWFHNGYWNQAPIKRSTLHARWWDADISSVAVQINTRPCTASWYLCNILWTTAFPHLCVCEYTLRTHSTKNSHWLSTGLFWYCCSPVYQKVKGKGWRKLVIDSAPTTFKDQCCVLCIYCLKSHYSYSCQFQFVVEQTKVWTLFLSLINCRALGEWTVKSGSNLHWGENVICVKSWYTLIADPGSW